MFVQWRISHTVNNKSYVYIYTCICIKLNAIINAIAETAVCNDSVYLDICVFSYLDKIPNSVFDCVDKFV